MKTFKNFFSELFETVIHAENHPGFLRRDPESLGLKSEDEVQNALKTDPVSVRVMEKDAPFSHGDLVGARLNINVLNKTGIPILTLHQATNKSGYKKNSGFYNGEARQYKQVATIRNAYFNVHQQGRENIASGRTSKFPMASVDGEYADVPPNFDGVEVKFNPKKHHLFVDSEGRAIRRADEVTLHGHRCYARGNIEYYAPENAPKQAGTSASEVLFKEEFQIYENYLDSL